ncbi:hypothetical protein KAR91_58555 [Candidatus Pacearchaeota archaeon]|nr:hypothetical protein [Candidatus Pacearchaeota archaeon]
MSFKKTLLYRMLTTPKEEYDKGGIYRVVLMLPYLLIVITFGIFIALFVDFYVALTDA